MWQCPKCKREFKRVNQSHYCGSAANVDDYIAEQDADVQPVLQKIRGIIKENAPDAEELLSWKMPTYRTSENIIHFAAHKKHISLYPGEAAASFFSSRLKGQAVTGASVGTIKFPLNKPIDYDLIADIVRWRVTYVEDKNK